jgi:hypothetical protein
VTNERTADGMVQDELEAAAVLRAVIAEGRAHALLCDLEMMRQNGEKMLAEIVKLRELIQPK